MTRLQQFTLALGLTVAISACGQSDADLQDSEQPDAAGMEHPADAAGMALSADDERAVTSVRQVAEGYRDVAAARAAGYTVQYPEGCVQTPEGSQGFHFLNESLLDETVELDRPELLMYEPREDGTLELIGVDYVIPFDRWTAAEPPQVLGRPMMRNEPLGVWALHIWTHRDNPSGIFAAFNPAANCDHAAAAQL